MENLYTTRCIRTFSGKYLNVFNPNPEDICIEDIAHALSQQPRFGGHLPIFFSVAQHSIMIANRLICEESEFILEGLLHDATEAYMCDLPRPIKLEMPDYKKVEDNLMAEIAKVFCLTYPFPEIIKRFDNIQLEDEWHSLMVNETKRANFFSRNNLLETRHNESIERYFIDFYNDFKRI